MVYLTGEFVACEPYEVKESTGLSSYFEDNSSLIALKVVLTSKAPTTSEKQISRLTAGNLVYVRKEYLSSDFVKNVYDLKEVKFIRIPHSEILGVEINGYESVPNSKCCEK